MTTLTILQTFKLLEEIQVPATFNKIVEVSGQDATDVALNLKLNMEHLEVDDRTSGAGTIYKLAYPSEYAEELRRNGSLASYLVRGTHIDGFYYHSISIPNVNKWTISFTDFQNSIATYNGNLPVGSSLIDYAANDTANNRVLFGVATSEYYTAKPFGNGEMEEWKVFRFKSLKKFLKDIHNIEYDDDLQMPEDSWTDLPGSLY